MHEQVFTVGMVIFHQGRGPVWLKGLIISQWIKEVCKCVPSGWLEAAEAAYRRVKAGTIAAPGLAEALAVMIPRLGWRAPAGMACTRLVMLTHLKVRDATAMQLEGAGRERAHAHACFINEAHGRGEGDICTPNERTALGVVFSACWAIKWENIQKEVYWRLAVDGVPDGHRWESLDDDKCACGAMRPRRGHFFWECKVAKVVVGDIQRCCPGQPTLTKINVWLMQPPPGVSVGIWRIVCLSAVNAMDEGRRNLLAARRWARDDDPDYVARAAKRPAASGRVVLRSNVDKVAAAERVAIVDFWGRMEDYAVLQHAPKGVGRASPFLRMDNGYVKLNRRHG
jgi:hypothetical protein